MALLLLLWSWFIQVISSITPLSKFCLTLCCSYHYHLYKLLPTFPTFLLLPLPFPLQPNTSFSFTSPCALPPQSQTTIFSCFPMHCTPLPLPLCALPTTPPWCPGNCPLLLHPRLALGEHHKGCCCGGGFISSGSSS